MQVTLRQFVKDFRNIVGQEAANKSLQLGKGQCKDHEEYKRIVGWIAGLEAGAEIADKMLRQMEEAQEEGHLPTMDPPQGEGR